MTLEAVRAQHHADSIQTSISNATAIKRIVHYYSYFIKNILI